MPLLSFTSKLGSLIHPLAFGVIVPLWFVTWFLGLKARQARKLPTSLPGGESEPLLDEAQSRRLQQMRGKRLHHKLSAALLFLTVFVMFLGMYNTFLRTGRLFPGPHLYGGLLFVLAISANAGLVPYLGDKDPVRLLHAGIGFAGVLLLLNQIWSGWPILKAVWTKIPW